MEKKWGVLLEAWTDFSSERKLDRDSEKGWEDPLERVTVGEREDNLGK
jgi:hypothetical protein